MNNWNKTLVVAVHPDDETLGCGGTLLKLKAMNKEIAWLIVTNTNETSLFSEEYTEKRKKEIESVKETYSFDKVYELPFQAGELENAAKIDVIKAINKAMLDFKPDTVFMPFLWDIHKEHQVAFESAFATTKSFRNSFVKRVIAMETPSETDFAPPHIVNSFSPNLFVDISDHIDKKIEIMKIFESEVLPHPFPRSIESLRALATVRGGQAGCSSAEAFMILKEIL